jgi:hypothetical protein
MYKLMQIVTIIFVSIFLLACQDPKPNYVEIVRPGYIVTEWPELENFNDWTFVFEQPVAAPFISVPSKRESWRHKNNIYVQATRAPIILSSGNIYPENGDYWFEPIVSHQPERIDIDAEQNEFYIEKYQLWEDELFEEENIPEVMYLRQGNLSNSRWFKSFAVNFAIGSYLASPLDDEEESQFVHYWCERPDIYSKFKCRLFNEVWNNPDYFICYYWEGAGVESTQLKKVDCPNLWYPSYSVLPPEEQATALSRGY